MLKKRRETFRSRSSASPRRFQGSGRARVETSEVEQDRGGELMAENGRQFLGAPQTSAIPTRNS